MSKRYLILAEGRSADAHYGKTMRGVVRYRPDEVVAILDSERAGESYEGVPIVGSVADDRSEERRVGKECTEQCRSRWSPYH